MLCSLFWNFRMRNGLKPYLVERVLSSSDAESVSSALSGRGISIAVEDRASWSIKDGSRARESLSSNISLLMLNSGRMDPFRKFSTDRFWSSVSTTGSSASPLCLKFVNMKYYKHYEVWLALTTGSSIITGQK